MATIDKLQIKVQADVTSANQSLSKLSSTLTKMQKSINNLNGGNLAYFANSVNQLSNTGNANNIASVANAISKLGYKSVSTAISNMQRLAPNLAQLSISLGKFNIGKSLGSFTALTKAVTTLGYKSAGTAVENIPKLSVALRGLFDTMSKAPVISENTIQMTNALANLAAQGGRVGSAARTISNGYNTMYQSSKKSGRGLTSLAAKFGKFYASCFLLIRAFRMLGKAINISSDLTEVENVVNMTFGQYRDAIDDFTKTSITAFGMSELTAKKIASRYQAMGTAMGFTTKKMSEMSVGLTGLAGDMASFYNVEQEVVAEDLEAIFTGQTRPLRQYGLDLTEANLKQWALTRGMNANIDAMTQADKAMLRYEYVMSQTASAQGDFARTSNTWHNQLVILKNLFIQLGQTVGTAFINLLKPVINTLNKIMVAVVNFAETVVNALGAIFGWKLEVQDVGITDAVDDAEDLADATGDAAKNAKELKRQLQGFDELNILNTNDDSSGGGGGGNITGGGDDKNKMFNITETENAFTSEIKTLEQLGSKIGTALTNAMNSIDWDSIYQGARNFGSGLASFLNGLISPELFGAVGKTIASSLNTAIYSALSFGQTFNFENFGNSIASGINTFFKTFDFSSLAQTLNVWVDGIKTAITTALKNISWSSILKGGVEFLTNLELDTVAIFIGAFTWKYAGKELTATLFSNLLKKQITTGIGSKTVSLSTAIGLTLTAAIIGFKIGNLLYDHIPKVKEWSDALAEWIFNGKDKIDIPRAIVVTLSGLTISLGAGALSELVIKGLKKAIKKKVAEEVTAAAVATSGLSLGTLALSVGGITIAAYGGYSIGKLVGKAFWGDDFKDEFDLSFSEIVKEIKDAANDGVLKQAISGMIYDLSGGRWGTKIEAGEGSETHKTDKGNVAGGGGGGFGDETTVTAKVTDVVVDTKLKDGVTIDAKANFTDTIKKNLPKDKKTINTISNFVSTIKDKVKNTKIDSISKFITADTTKINNLHVPVEGEITPTWVVTPDGGKTMIKENNGRRGYYWKGQFYAAKRGGIFEGGKYTPISQFASGGVPTYGTHFIAGESGPEVVGHIGGRSEVLNQSQLASVMYNAVKSAMSEMGSNTANVNVVLEGDANQLFKVTQNKANDYFNRTGRPAFPV